MIADWSFGVQTRRQSSSCLVGSHSLSCSALSVKTEGAAAAAGPRADAGWRPLHAATATKQMASKAKIDRIEYPPKASRVAMRRAHRWLLKLVVTCVVSACAAANRQARPVAFAAKSWRLRIDVDSAPTRIGAKGSVVGTIDFATHRHTVDFWRAISHRIPDGAYAVSVGPRQYKFVLGDSASFDEKIVMTGSAVTADSIVGTWTETIVCCSAGGRFVLWR